ncbi:neugrin [Notechis scutatus]|uniref:Neugrin n=1 Tax=Notechis scutatus TaxID=8663 RepID=A0A6J1VCG6_9SAUR|nr:neugrin [Notechis scutatus]
MKPPRVPDPRKLLAGLAAARADGGVPALDEQLQEVERRLQCRARQTRERRLRKLMGPPEAPEPRALSLRAMEQIRYLRSAFPEEWPADRLAQGFGVTPEVIYRVLKSRFRPSPERGLKQDARAGARPSPAPACGAAPAALEPPARLWQEGAAASRARLPGLVAGGPSVAVGRRPEGARGSAGKAGKARAPRSRSKEAPGEGPEGPAAS